MAAKKQLEVGSKVRLVQYKMANKKNVGTNFTFKGEIVEISGDIIKIQYEHMNEPQKDFLKKWQDHARYWQKVWTLEVVRSEEVYL